MKGSGVPSEGLSQGTLVNLLTYIIGPKLPQVIVGHVAQDNSFRAVYMYVFKWGKESELVWGPLMPETRGSPWFHPALGKLDRSH